MRKIAIFTLFCLILVLTLPLAITTIVMGAIKPGNCDKTDEMNLNVSTYLIVNGSTNLIFSIIIVTCLFCIYFEKKQTLFLLILTIFLILYVLFSTAWLIIGGVILFRSNIECIKEESTHVIFALALWSISILQILIKLLSNNRD